MKTSLDHLPDYKQEQLARAKEIILERAQPDLLILYGSYARGDWVEEKEPDLPFYRYQSDFDLLAIVKNEHLAHKIERKLSLESELSRAVKTPVSLIAEDIRHVNLQLSKARYFYVDIVKEGILLHDSEQLRLGEPKELTVAERKGLAEEDYATRMAELEQMQRGYAFYFNDNALKLTAFTLHQITERLLSVILLVFTHYKPKTHDLAKLREMVNAVEPAFVPVFPLGDPEEKRRFELLRSAYVDARYSQTYSITREELVWLSGRVRLLHEWAEQLCRRKIESFVQPF